MVGKKRLEAMLNMFKDLLELTKKALTFAQGGDFSSLESIISEREEILKRIDSCGNPQLGDKEFESIKEIIVSVGELDKEIASLLQQEMTNISHEISDVITQLRVLSAYSTGNYSGGRFDTTL